MLPVALHFISTSELKPSEMEIAPPEAISEIGMGSISDCTSSLIMGSRECIFSPLQCIVVSPGGLALCAVEPFGSPP